MRFLIQATIPTDMANMMEVGSGFGMGSILGIITGIISITRK